MILAHPLHTYKKSKAKCTDIHVSLINSELQIIYVKRQFKFSQLKHQNDTKDWQGLDAIKYHKITILSWTMKSKLLILKIASKSSTLCNLILNPSKKDFIIAL